MTAEPWTPNEIDEAEKWFHLREMVEANSERSAPLSAVLRALATIRALQAEIAELKTPSGYCDDEGEAIWKPDGHGFDPAATVADLETMLDNELYDDGAIVTFTPYRQLPKETYRIKYVADADGIMRVRLERVEQSQHPIGNLREEAK